MSWISRSLALALVISALGGSAEAARKLRVIATIPDLKALTEAVGGDLVEVESLARGSQNPHDLEVRPSLMLKVRRADVLVVNGLDLDQWADAVVRGANNPNVIPGATGFVDASTGIPVLEVPTTRVDRSMGDVHPLGNPHYTVDPGLAPLVTQNIADGLSRVAPDQRPAFARNRQAFVERLQAAMARWQQALVHARGAKLVTYHNDWVYFLTRFGIQQVGTIEERPGIPPSPAHLARLIQRMRDEKVTVVAVEPWSDQKLAARIAGDVGARVVVLNARLATTAGANAYIETTEANVTALAGALRERPAP
jgi:zinc/manganese transport system substrate-binding protein